MDCKKDEYMALLEKLNIKLQGDDREKLEEGGKPLLKLVMKQLLICKTKNHTNQLGFDWVNKNNQL